LAGGLNLYGFAQGDPVNHSDPFGLAPCCRLQIGIGLVAAVNLRRGVSELLELASDALSGGGCSDGVSCGAPPNVVPGIARLGSAARTAASAGRLAARLAGYRMHLTARDLSGAVGEIERGVQQGGQHLKEVSEAMSGLRGFIDDLNQALSNPELTRGARRVYEEALGAASRMLDRAERALSTAQRAQ